MATLELKGLTKVYEGGTVGVDKLNLTLEDGGFLVIVGPSGCGKTTTLRMIAGLEDITSGELLIDGKVMNNVPPKDRDIAMVFQNYALYPHMSVFDNMAFGLKLRKVPKDVIKQKVIQAAKILGIEELLDRKPKQLSGGQRQRVAMGRAIVREPKVFLFDEPLSNLDAKMRVQMRVELKLLQKKLGTTTVYVTHDQVEAMTLATKIAVMNKGKLQQAGTPSEIYFKPANRFVAEFIGSPSMNFLKAKYQDGKVITPNNLVITPPFDLGTHEEIEIGIRPQDLKVIRDIKEGVNRVSGRIEVIEDLGSERFGYISIPDARIIARLPSDVGEGDNVGVVFEPELCHFFDKEGNRIGG